MKIKKTPMKIMENIKRNQWTSTNIKENQFQSMKTQNKQWKSIKIQCIQRKYIQIYEMLSFISEINEHAIENLCRAF